MGISRNSFFDDEQKRLTEERKHAKRGGCIGAILLVVLIGPLCWALFTFTSGGQALASYAAIIYAYYGLPVHRVTAGLPDTARWGCDLDRANPRPADYVQQQEYLQSHYESNAETYRKHYQKLVRLKKEVSWFEDPEKVPSRYVGGKLYFCNR
jgi:hypothetical protein